MGKKSLGLGKAHDYGAGMKANAQAAMPEIMAVNGGKGKLRGIPAMLGQNVEPGVGKTKAKVMPQTLPPDDQDGQPMKRGGKPRHLASGGGLAQVIRKGGATPSGAPKKISGPVSPKVKSRGVSGSRGG